MILSFTDARGLGIVESSVGLAFLFGSMISLRLADKLQGNLKVAIYMGLLGGLSLSSRVNQAKHISFMCTRDNCWSQWNGTIYSFLWGMASHYNRRY